MGNRSDKREIGRLIPTAVVAFCVAMSLTTPLGAAPECREDAVSLRGDWGQARFNIEVADDAAERAQGLMFRNSMPGSSGMLFVYERPQRMSFWMRNTLIPLDMLFIDQRGVVRHIHHEAKPLDETPISGGDAPMYSVLEINGGLARRMGLDVGTQLRHPAFTPFGPAWPC